MAFLQTLWFALLAAQAIVVVVLIIFALRLRKQIMPIIAAFETALTDLTTVTGELQTALAAASTLPAGAASAQDVTDTAAAVQAAADALKAIVPLTPAA